VAAGFVNAVSAAGSLITLPVLIFTGLSAGEANATNRVGILAQNFSSAMGFRSKGFKTENYMWWLAAAAIPGAILGAWFSLKIPDALFNKILSVVMIVFLIITLTNPLKSMMGSMPRLEPKRKLLGVVTYFFIGMYGGFIQAGSGFFIMAGCMLIHGFDIVKTNHYKAVIMLTYTVAAFLIFLFKGNINWVYGIVLSAGMATGGFMGSRWSISASEKWLKVFITVVIIAMAFYLWVFK
jgi:hypothetical protein